MPNTTRTTIALPSHLLAAADEAVARGDARSRNDLIARALSRQLVALRRRRIDEEFAEMANDPIYRDEASQLVEDFVVSDWEALRRSAQSRSDDSPSAGARSLPNR